MGGRVVPPLPIIDVTDHRVLGVDDPTAIRNAVDAAIAANISFVYFPPGEYLLGRFEGNPSLRFADLRCITFFGDGDCSVLRRIDDADADDVFSAACIFGFDRCTDITIMDMSVDLNGFQPNFGASQRSVLEFLECSRVSVENVTFTDSGSRVAGDLSGDLSAFLHPRRISHRFDTAHHLALGFGGVDDLAVRRNRFVTCGLAVHGGSRIRIADNTFDRSHGHAIAVGASVEGVRHDDVEIVGNFVDRPLGFGVVVADIPPTPLGRLDSSGDPALGVPPGFHAAGMNGIRIEGNTVLKPEPAHYPRGIVVGLLHFLGTDEGGVEEVNPGTLYSNVVVRDNLVDLRTLLSRAPPEGPANTFPVELRRVAGVWLQVPASTAERWSDPALAAFERAVVTGNSIKGAKYDEVANGAGVVAIHLRRSEIAGNGLYGCDVGLFLGVVNACHIHDNRAQVLGLAYRCGLISSDTFSGNATVEDGEGRADTRWDIGRSAAVVGEDRLTSWFTGGDSMIPARERLP